MKTLLAVALMGSMLLGGCSAFHGGPGPQAPDAPELAVTPAAGANDAGTPIEKIPFRIGVSSATVERLARQQACTGGQGAGLITAPGPVEVYRMQCENGKIFMARCELRQCRQM
jgi:hypothetical protein